MEDSGQTGAPRSRRALLTAAAGGAAALAVAAIRPTAVEAAPGNMQTESDNATIAPTGISNATADSLGFYSNGTGAGGGVEGTSESGIGVRGVSPDTSDPENNPHNAGVVGIAATLGSEAPNIALTGVYGYSDPSPADGFVGAGVWGDSPDFGVIGSGGIGVLGEGPIGVIGFATEAGGIGVEAGAEVANALALHVAGRAEFSRSGRAIVRAGKQKRTVTLAGCTSSTLVIAMINSNRSGRWVRAAVPTSGQFIIYLNDNVNNDTQVSWIALTNPSNSSG